MLSRGRAESWLLSVVSMGFLIPSFGSLATLSLFFAIIFMFKKEESNLHFLFLLNLVKWVLFGSLIPFVLCLWDPTLAHLAAWAN